MKIKTHILLTVLIVCIALSGCAGNNNTPELNNKEGNTLDKSIELSDNDIEVDDITNNIPLNIIDDNYRNYYEIFVYSFYDSDSDGIGDLKGVDSKLSYIKDMGFNGIWLMPIMPSTTYHKYDVIDYMDIDEEYGNLEDMKALIEHAHAKDINIIIDFVMNHTSSKHIWFTTACDYLRTLDVSEVPDNTVCPYVDYYHFSKEKVNNSYHKVPGCDWYYEGSFWDQMPDLNFSSDALKEEFEKIASFWIGEMKVDGFRMDATMHFEEGDTAFNTEVMNWIYEYAKGINPNFYMVSEVWAGESTIADYYESKTDSLFNFDVADAEGKLIKAAKGALKAEKFVNSMLEYELTFKERYSDYIDAVFITNHDMGRVANALQSDEASIKYAGGLLMSMNGSTYVYYGEEIGMKSKGKKDENKRLPIDWGENSGNTLGPKDADKDIEQRFDNVYTQLQDETSILNYYKKALLIRNQNPEIARGSIYIDEKFTKDNMALITKSYNNSKICILYNNSPDSEAEFNLSGTEYEAMNIVGYLTVDNSTINKNDGNVILPPRSIVYIK